MEYYSHVAGGRKERVEEHLELTAEYAEKYATEVGFPKFGYLLGFFHDAGKMTEKFQKILKRQAERVNHALPGAAILFSEFPELIGDEYGRQVAFGIVKGHHAGLTAEFDEDLIEEVEESVEGVKTDWNWEEDGKKNSLSSEKEYSEILNFLKNRSYDEAEELSELSDMPVEDKMLFIRLMLSCLVDGDYTSTYLFEENKQECESPTTKNWYELTRSLNEYRSRFDSPETRTLPINAMRNAVYEYATNAGRTATAGLYGMTAPTGTAKTLAMISFALECAKRNEQKRIFVVLPYLSIIDQTVKIYKEIFGDDVVLEDDSTAEYKTETSQTASILRLLSEKWDYQIIVTSNVKFYETLFSSKPKTLRKLHGVANSVVLFDESQTLPSDVADLSLNTLDALTKYNVTVLFSTATPPDFSMRKRIRKVPNEIIGDVDKLYSEYEKVHSTTTKFLNEKVSYEKLMETIDERKQALFVFNTTGKARGAYDELKKRFGDDAFVLYTMMCGAHRRKVVEEVKKRLENGRPCLLASTQCIEAGVDVDFPIVCREYAPYPSVVQSMGRCNRNGKGTGKAFVFSLEENGRTGYPDDRYRTESKITRRMAEERNFDVNLSDMSTLKAYYKKIFAGDGPENADKSTLSEAVEEMDFVETDREYKIIDEKNQISIIVPYDDGKGTYEKALRTLEGNGFSITKKLMAETHAVVVSMYASSKKAQAVSMGCQRLYATCLDGKYETNWFVMLDKKGYSDEHGLETNEETGGGLFG